MTCIDLRRTCVRSTQALAVILVLAGTAVPAGAQTFGVRAGASVDPDQFYFGGHLEATDLVENRRFRPNVEVGIGDDLTLIALNFELAYHFRMRSPWHVYAGGGPALNIVDGTRIRTQEADSTSCSVSSTGAGCSSS